MPQNASSLEKDSTGQSISTADVLNLTPQQQDTVANFDKISFLSDQVKTLLWKFFSNIFIEHYNYKIVSRNHKITIS